MPCTDGAYATTRHHAPTLVDTFGTRCPLSLRACYAMSGTDLAYQAHSCSQPYTVSSTLRLPGYDPPLACYASATRCPVLNWHIRSRSSWML
eukprot:1791222-Rhodomonas_salina.4